MSTSQATWFGQPRGLTILFLTEMWEKFSFFGMRTLLVYYMTKQLLIGQEKASLIYGLYAACAYLTPIAGGYIADRWLGTRRAVIAGGAIMSLGHFMMASESLFLPALATIALGNGLFLPNLPSQIHGLYCDRDPRRGPAYNLYYAGINLGAFFAPLICGTLGEVYGWHYGFGAAGIGMLLGLLIYVGGARYLPPDTPRVTAETSNGRSGDITRQMILLVSIALVVVVFRGAYEQLGNTFAIWADQGIDRRIAAGLTIPMTWFQSLNPMFVFLLTPVLVIWWTRAGRRGRDPSPLVKMAMGAALVGSAYLMLALLLSVQVGVVSWVGGAVCFSVDRGRAAHSAYRSCTVRSAGAAASRCNGDGAVVSRLVRRQSAGRCARFTVDFARSGNVLHADGRRGGLGRGAAPGNQKTRYGDP